MKEYTPETAEFSDSITIPETTDTNHADNINSAPKQLIANTLANREEIENIIGDNTDWQEIDYSDVPNIVNVAETPAIRVKNGIVAIKGNFTCNSLDDITLNFDGTYAPEYEIRFTKSNHMDYSYPIGTTGEYIHVNVIRITTAIIDTDGTIKISASTMQGADSEGDGSATLSADLSGITWMLK